MSYLQGTFFLEQPVKRREGSGKVRQEFPIIGNKSKEGLKLGDICWSWSLFDSLFFSSVGYSPAAEIQCHKYSKLESMSVHFDLLRRTPASCKRHSTVSRFFR